MTGMNLTLREQLDTLSTTEWAALHGRKESQARKYCEQGDRIPGARLEAGAWRIPRNAPWPEDRRVTRGKSKKRKEE